MKNQKIENLITVLDAGSSKSCVLVAELHDGVLRYRGHGVEPSKGMRKGLIAELGPAAEAINRSALMAERSAKAAIETAVVGIGGTHVRGMNSRGGISLGSRMREITREEVRAAVDRARSVALPADREVLHLLPQEFILDDQQGIHDPIGMVGNKLEVNLHLSTCSGGVAQSVITCANRAGLEVLDTVYEGIASAEAVLSADERELGVCIADIGSSTTELAVFFEGSVAHTAVLPIGGDHFTNDLAVGLHVTVEEAEHLKKTYGHCIVTAVPQSSEIEVGGDLAISGGQPARLVRQRFLAEILEPRARELFTMMRDNLRQGGVLEALGAGCVVTGGGALMAGLLDNAESLLRVPARIGYPVPLSKMPDELVRPEYATMIGMLLYTHRTQVRRASEEQGLRSKLKSIFAGSF
ncbi:cell division protein FtsA [Edaphobacter sp. 12200R-103]|jgi:cell division protein FtsA|uniref:cell division protein FtsA n=1 Tax=Edaphobacter sp. 12200R-103 TaxID=2703788 RepID=UPI00138B74A6|nr:cell division protein FtsA [Edaphobacter sp. 12200R-103]QHS51815.1 cell division protein FtsA [Edaphobacter sp. 12200R-103]